MKPVAPIFCDRTLLALVRFIRRWQAKLRSAKELRRERIEAGICRQCGLSSAYLDSELCEHCWRDTNSTP